MEVRVDHLAVVPKHLAARGAQGTPHLRRLARNPGVHLVPHVRPRVEPLRLPAAPVPEGEGSRDHRLREHRLPFLRPAGPHFAADHARQVTLDRYPVDQRQPRGVANHAQPPPVATSVRHGEPVLGNVDGRDAGALLAGGAVGLHEPDSGGVGDDRPPRARGNGAERLAVRVVAEQQLAAPVAAQRDAARAGEQSHAQLGLGARREGGSGPRAAARPRHRDGASEPAPRPAPRRVV